ncbi:glutamine synthetase family protein [uncultured Roseovarius sp.]|uniref:glutamine synthetase family protein n=1 Tax=uncultured Roseovarius sp. TaxID=293344 RepID=UPI002610687D|nr:glutamine synthetase family protein [uncultured Roseovarius sp.]
MTQISTVDAVAEKLREDDVRYVRFEMSDIMGIPRSKTVPIGAFSSFAKKGVNMYGGTLGLDSGSYVVPDTGIAEEVGYMDAFLIPDLSTLTVLPWDRRSASLICTPHWGQNRVPLEQAPRNLLQVQLDKAHAMGFSVKSGHELEFYLYDGETKEPLFAGQHIFATARNHYTDFINDLMDTLTEMGFELTTHNAEYAPSQFEINFAPQDGMSGADSAFRFKAIVKEFAARNGLLATFMSKPQLGLAGCGYHLHMGLNDANSGENKFNDPDDPDGLSEMALQFTAGILAHTNALTALMAPTINCYHRFQKGSFAPSRATWGIEDRTALLRMKASRDKATHLEMRGGAGMANPYLFQAATLAAGLIGIEQKLTLADPKPGLAEDDATAPALPQTLGEALACLESDTDLCAVLGDPFVRLFTTVKRFELDRAQQHISDWEHNEYLELY